MFFCCKQCILDPRIHYLWNWMTSFQIHFEKVFFTTWHLIRINKQDKHKLFWESDTQMEMIEVDENQFKDGDSMWLTSKKQHVIM